MLKKPSNKYTMAMNKALKQLVIKNRPLFWDVPEKSLGWLSEEATFERFLCYGDWESIKLLENILGRDRERQLLHKILQKKRQNLKPETVSFFKDYFSTHA